MNSTSLTDNETDNSHPTAMDTMDNSLYSLNPYPPLLLTAKQSQKQWDRHVRVEGCPTAMGLSALSYARSLIPFLIIPTSSAM
jgi:hypothetical protein